MALIAIGAVCVGRAPHRTFDRTRVCASFDQVNSVADLREVALARHDLGFQEFNQMGDALGSLVDKLRRIAVDRTSSPSRSAYSRNSSSPPTSCATGANTSGNCSPDINKVSAGACPFSIFKIDDDELFDLEIFWRAVFHGDWRDDGDAHPPGAGREQQLLRPSLVGGHQPPHRRPSLPEVTLGEYEVSLRVKSFFVDSPKIGGIVGIGYSEVLEDETRHLVMESVLSTLLNVVGSVKAIYKYPRSRYYATRDPLTDLFQPARLLGLAGYEVSNAPRLPVRPAAESTSTTSRSSTTRTATRWATKYLQHFARQVQDALRAGGHPPPATATSSSPSCPKQPEAVALVAERVQRHRRHACRGWLAASACIGTGSIGLAVFPDHAESARTCSSSPTT